MNVYDFISWFFMYSFLDYLLECTVLSVEYRRPVADRGFGYGPFRVIYGLSTLGACMLLRPVSGSLMEPYTAFMAMATTMELATAGTMVRLFGSFWWGYSRKPFNYKGVICLESSPGWGLLDLFLFYFLDIRVRAAVSSLPSHVGPVLTVGLTMFCLVDFIHYFRLRLGGMKEESTPAVGRLKVC